MNETFGKLHVAPYPSEEQQWQICVGQDGEIFGDDLFRFDHKGKCYVYSIKERSLKAQFMLDKIESVCPHSNSVSFSSRYYAPEDEFPVLYTNVYNTYAKETDRREGMCCAYRIQREGNQYTSTLLQTIQIGFVENRSQWTSCDTDVRPYGNFVVDGETLYAFVMRDAAHQTRFFRFALPPTTEKTVLLQETDILNQFDLPYFDYVQGATAKDGRIISLEGFEHSEHKPMIRVIDPAAGKITAQLSLQSIGLDAETEYVASADKFRPASVPSIPQDAMIYINNHGQVYILTGWKK